MTVELELLEVAECWAQAFINLSNRATMPSVTVDVTQSEEKTTFVEVKFYWTVVVCSEGLGCSCSCLRY